MPGVQAVPRCSLYDKSGRWIRAEFTGHNFLGARPAYSLCMCVVFARRSEDAHRKNQSSTS